MARKKKNITNADRERRRDERLAKEQDVIVQDTLARVTCTVKTAEDMTAQCECRLEEIEGDLTFAGLAFDVWRRQSAGQELVPLLEQLLAEQRRHAEVMGALAQRFDVLTQREHEHLSPDAVDLAWLRGVLFPQPADPVAVDRQISTESGRR
jgi:hypothetical protein